MSCKTPSLTTVICFEQDKINNKDSLNIVFHLGPVKAKDLFHGEIDLFKKCLQELKLYNTSFASIIDLIIKSIK